MEALTVMSAVVDGKKKTAACDRLVKISEAANKNREHLIHQLLLVALFHVYRVQGANDKAEVVIGMLWGLAQQGANKWSWAGNAYLPVAPGTR